MIPSGAGERKIREVEGAMGVEDEVLTAEEAALLLKISEKTLLRLVRDGDLPGQKVGRAWRFCRTELIGYLSPTTEKVRAS